MKQYYVSVVMLAAALSMPFQHADAQDAVVIPEGSEIASYISANLATGSSFALQAGKTYELKDTIDFKLSNVSITGDATNRPVVKVSEQGAFVIQNGLQLKDINFDMTEAPLTALICMSQNPDESLSTEALGYKALGGTKDGYVCQNPVSMVSCNVRNIPSAIFSGAAQPSAWAVADFRIEDCVMQINKQNNKAFISLDDSWAGVECFKTLTLKNSTFYNISSVTKARFIRVGSRTKVEQVFGTGTVMTHNLENCTFYRTFPSDKFGNNIVGPQTTVNSCILVDISRPDKWFKGESGGKIISDNNNMAWGAGDDGGVAQDMRNEIKEIAYIEDPMFSGPTDLAFDLAETFGGVNFHPCAQTAIDNKIGDPRWFEAAVSVNNWLTVPATDELSTFVANNVPDDSKTLYHLVLNPGATYELGGIADFKTTQVEIVGDETNRPVVNVTGAGAFWTQNGLTLKNVDFDMTDAPITSLVEMSQTPDSMFYQAADDDLGLKAGFICPNPITFENSNIKNLPGSLFSSGVVAGGAQPWAVNEINVLNTVIQFNKQNGDAVISFEYSWSSINGVKDLNIKNSTFYNTSSYTKGRFLRYGNKGNAQPAKIWGKGAQSNHVLANNTFYETFSGNKFANNVPEVADYIVTINSNILYDINRPDEWFWRSHKNTYKTDKKNIIWLAGTGESMRSEVDSIGVVVNPLISGPTDKVFDLSEEFGGVNFHPCAEKAIEFKAGDPRWFNAAVSANTWFTIPEGSEISAYVAENIPDNANTLYHVALLPGVTYELADTADFRTSQVEFIGDAAQRPVINVTGNGVLYTQNGLSLTDIDFDMTDAPVTSLIMLSQTPDSIFYQAANDSLGLKAGFIAPNPFTIENSNIKNLPGSLFSSGIVSSGAQPWAANEINVLNTVIQFNKQNSDAVISFEYSWSSINGVKDLNIKNSTFYNTSSYTQGRFLRYGNKGNAQPAKIWGKGAESNHVLANNTFYETFSGNKFANNVPEVADYIVTLNSNILYNINRPDEWFWRSHKNTYKTDHKNVFWLAGTGETMRSEVDSVGIVANPLFVGPVNLPFDLAETFGGVNFHPQDSLCIADKVGDPRWYDAAVSISTIFTIPEETEISAFVAENLPDNQKDVAYTFNLVPGGKYTLSGVADSKMSNISYVGDADNRPTVAITTDGTLVASNGLSVSGINFDMTEAPLTSFITLQNSPDSCFTTKYLGMMNDSSSVVNGYIMLNPITVESCNFRDLPSSFLAMDSIGWALAEVNIDNCVVQFNKKNSNAIFNFSNAENGSVWNHFGQIKDLNVKNTTFYNPYKYEKKVYFLRYVNAKSAMPYLAFGAGAVANHTYDNCTFYKTFEIGNLANNTPKSENFVVTFNNSIFYGISRPDKYHPNGVLNGEGNVTWDGGLDDDGNPQTVRESMKLIGVEEDPQFAGLTDLPFDLAEVYGGVSFNPLNPYCQEHKTGDPRWFDAPTAIRDIVDDAPVFDGPVEYFNLNGIRVNAENLIPGIYIKRQGSKTQKVYVK